MEPMGITFEGEAQLNGHHDHLTHWTPWIPEDTQVYAVKIRDLRHLR
jgi:hypothetical protein